jgi:hypothetical protein
MDIQTLTLGEVSKIEEISGLPLSAMADEDKPKGKQMAAIAFVIMKRKDSTYTMKQAEELTFAEVTELLGKASAKK